MTTNYSASHANGFTSEGSVTEDKLFDNFSMRQKVTIPSGQGALLRATAMGKILFGAVTSAVKVSGANTGNGTCVVDATEGKLANVIGGVYQLRVITAGANAATFRMYDPRGRVVKDFSYSGSGATVVTDAHIKVTLTDGATDFVVGDGFDVTVAISGGNVGKWTKAIKAAVDGSATVRGILLHDADATSADIDGVIGRIGTCNGAAVIFGAGLTLADVFEECLDRGLVFSKVFG